jgi:hypothetical protein
MGEKNNQGRNKSAILSLAGDTWVVEQAFGNLIYIDEVVEDPNGSLWAVASSRNHPDFDYPVADQVLKREEKGWTSILFPVEIVSYEDNFDKFGFLADGTPVLAYNEVYFYDSIGHLYYYQEGDWSEFDLPDLGSYSDFIPIGSTPFVRYGDQTFIIGNQAYDKKKGFVLVHDGSSWQLEDSLPDIHYPRNLFACGDRLWLMTCNLQGDTTFLWWYNGKEWNLADLLEDPWEYKDRPYCDNGDLWVLAFVEKSNSYKILSNAGKGWATVADFSAGGSYDLEYVFAPSTGHPYVYGTEKVSQWDYRGVIMQYDGAAMTEMTLPSVAKDSWFIRSMYEARDGSVFAMTGDRKDLNIEPNFINKEGTWSEILLEGPLGAYYYRNDFIAY